MVGIYYKTNKDEEYTCVEGREATITIQESGRTIIYAYVVDKVGNESEIANKEIKKRKEKNYWAWEYISTNISPNMRSLAIELHIWLKYKRVVYTNCILVLNTNEIEFIWE